MNEFQIPTANAGAGGIALLIVFSLLLGLGFGALGAFLALRTGSGEAVQVSSTGPSTCKVSARWRSR